MQAMMPGLCVANLPLAAAYANRLGSADQPSRLAGTRRAEPADEGEEANSQAERQAPHRRDETGEFVPT
jgi:hypothetical protein